MTVQSTEESSALQGSSPGSPGPELRLEIVTSSLKAGMARVGVDCASLGRAQAKDSDGILVQ